jgi:1-aminocyclopropane-1-carboxylate deaminase/D-cysteine desulfhydrase-like pyridoxal-dependent ACC family enzyme
MTKVAVIGNTGWQNRRKIQQTLQELKQRFGTDLIIIGAGGQEGANTMVRKYALEFGMQYQEFNPSFSGYNLYSAMPESYYGKPYHFSQLHHRMKLIAQHCDYMMIMTNESALDPVLKTAYTNVKKLEKPVVILG